MSSPRKRIKKWRKRGWPVCGDAWRRSVDGSEQLPGSSREVQFSESDFAQAECTPLYLVPFVARLGMHRTGENTWMSDGPLPGCGTYIAHLDTETGEAWLDWSYSGRC